MSTQKIKVFVRCRPLNEKENGFAVEVSPDRNEIKLLERHNSSINSNDTKHFYYDQVFAPQARQEDVYKTVVNPLIDQVLLGFNCTVFAYGQTGTGKTYTMEGYRSDKNLSWDEDPHCGIIPRAVSQLLDALQDEDSKFTVSVSFLELYNEDAYDLLSSIEDSTKLRIYDDVQRKGSVIVHGLKEEVVKSKEDIFDILERGSAKRQTAATLLNACSSRSHTIFSITVHIREGSMQGNELLKVGKLNLVDLAGSENIGRSGASDIRAREAGNINQALLTLGRVITALVENRPHIPYRESKLTRMLQDSLGGKTKTSLIATISPSPLDYEDTVNVLDYASRAKNITNNPEKNQRTLKHSNGSNEIDRLRKELESFQERHMAEMNDIEYKVRNEVAVEFKREMERLKQSYKDTYEEHMQDVIKSRDDIFNQLQATISELDASKTELEAVKTELEAVKSELEAVRTQSDAARTEFEAATTELEATKMELVSLKSNLEATKVEFEAARSESEAAKTKLNATRTELEAMKTELKAAESESKAKISIVDTIGRQIDEFKEPVVEKKATKIRSKIPEEPEDGYANLTFDEDEIAVASAKKPRGKKRVINNPAITLSGKKKKITNYDEILELSPVPTRVTRSRATRRKLDF